MAVPRQSAGATRETSDGNMASSRLNAVKNTSNRATAATSDTGNAYIPTSASSSNEIAVRNTARV